MKCLVLVTLHSLKSGCYYHRFAVVPASLLEAILAVSSVELRCRGRAEGVGASAGKGGEGKGLCTPVPVPSRVPDSEEVLNQC